MAKLFGRRCRSFESRHFFGEALVLCFEGRDLFVHRFELCQHVVGVDFLTGAALADAERHADISRRLVVAIKRSRAGKRQ